jgi:predicted amidohydrolase YtcJ
MIVEQLMESKAAVVVLCIGVSVALSMGCAATGPQPPTPDTILVGQFITLDPSKPRVEALALLKGRIVATGRRDARGPLVQDCLRRGARLTRRRTDRAVLRRAERARSLQQASDADLDKAVRAVRAQGFQVNIHAIGDKAVRRVLDAFERAGVTPAERFRVEHASMTAPWDMPRFARLGVVASVQPVFVGEYSRWAEERVGPKRIHWVLPIRDLVVARAPIAFGTDYTASDSGDPIANLAGAVARQSSEGLPAAGWYPEQKVDMETALGLISAGSAFAAFQEKDLGQLTVGRYADVTVLSDDPLKIKVEDVRTLVVRMTIVAGRSTYDARAGQ